MKTAAYFLLNYDDKVCRTFARPVRESSGKCAGEPVLQEKRGGRWQVRQALAALGTELRHVAFIAVDVEWFLSAGPANETRVQAYRRQYILDAIDELERAQIKPVIYTRNAKRHWRDITGCDGESAHAICKALASIPLWDVETGDADLGKFQPYAHWTTRAGRQYLLDANLFGLPQSRTIDLNVFDAALFAR